ncbi:MAG: hypothetical protein U1F56_13270 [Rubrivivax sp.]
MNTGAHAVAHLDWDALVAYWLGDGDVAGTEAADEHLMHCDACGTRLDELIALSRGVRDAFTGGRIATVLGAPFVDALKAAGRRVREYRVPLDGGVHCAVEPGDELVVSRLSAPLAGVPRLDALVTRSIDPGHAERLQDIPFDAATGEVLLAPRLDTLRRLPSHETLVRLFAVDGRGERELGSYRFHHRGADAPGPA